MANTSSLFHLQICPPGESILNLTQLWFTPTPTFNRCLLQTVPILLPLAFLLTLLPFHLCLLFRQHRPQRPTSSIPLNLYNISRFLAVAVVIAVALLRFGYNLYFYMADCSRYSVAGVDLINSLLTMGTYFLFGTLLHVHRLAGIHTSGLAWLFTATSLFLALPQLYMYLLSTNPNILPGFSWNLVECALFSTHLLALLVLFILTCFADQRPGGRKKSGRGVSGPEVHLSSLDTLQEDLRNGISFGILSSTSLIKRNFLPTLFTFDLDPTSLRTSRVPEPLQKQCPDQYVSFLSLRTYWWFYGLGFTGLHKTLTLADLWALNTGYRCKEIVGQFYKHWFGQLTDTTQTKPSIALVLLREYGWQFALSTALKLAHVMLVFVLPQLLKICIEFISTPAEAEPTWHGYFIAFSFLFISTVQSFLHNYYLHVMYSMGMKIRSGLISLIYRKTVNLSAAARRRANTGEIINLMAVDSQRFADLLPFLNLIWSAPLLISLTMYFLWIELGPSIFAGLSVMLLLFTLDRRVSTCEQSFQAGQMAQKDERVQLTAELFSAIRTVKLHSWEMPFIKRVTAIRSQEIGQLERIAYIGVVTSFLWTSAPFMVSFATFSAYILSSEENRLDAKKAFVSLCLLNILRFPFAVIPQLFNTIAMASVSVKRMDRFFNDEEVEEYVLYEGIEDPETVLEISNGSFSWGAVDGNSAGTAPKLKTLSGINLKIQRGSLVAVCGYSGTGKSSLLSAILGHMELLEGSVKIANQESAIAYVPQQPWIQTASLRENILFGAEYDPSRYSTILDRCGLSSELAALPNGDQTEIGEDGITLSGGQRQRIALARACYSQAPLLLLDDPLSAVDSHISKRIFNKVISTKSGGFLSGRTRIMVTNDCSFLSEFDQIILLKHGRIIEAGSYQQLMANCQGFARYIHENVECKRVQYQLTTLLTSEEIQRCNSIDSVRSWIPRLPRRQGICPLEKTETGRVKLSVYANYFRLLTCLWLSMMLIGFVGMQIASVISNIWLAIWSNDHHASQQSSTGNKYLIADVSRRNRRLVVYTVIGLTQGLFFLLGAVSLAKGTVTSSQTLHRVLLERMIHCPMAFFEATPLGRITNRFSKDIDTIDSAIPNVLRALLLCLLQVVSIFVLISTEVPGFMLVIFPILFIYYVIQKFYVTISRQLKRLESITRSPIFSHFTETFSGLPTLRAFSRLPAYIETSDRLVDINQQTCYPGFIANRWLSSRLELCGNLIVFFVALFTVHSRSFYQTQPAFVALIITYSLNITTTLNWFIRMGSEMENNIVSVERVDEYCQVPAEAQWNRGVNATPALPEDWPTRGQIEFIDLSVRYRKELGLVLNRVNIRIGSGEKIGIVGRTGCGKSTLSLALFRILEATEGAILVDGVDISQIGLHELRTKLSIIPQDPVLFTGTLRFNLDPFESTPDDQLWNILHLCHLRQYIMAQNHGLDLPIAEGGANLSVGQRQLVCLGRALIRRSRILVLDEATAAIDLETDALIQETIRSEFAGCTVLTIAHRLHSVMDCDRVLVMHQGGVAEFDSPAALLADSTSRFYQMAQDERLI